MKKILVLAITMGFIGCGAIDDALNPQTKIVEPSASFAFEKDGQWRFVPENSETDLFIEGTTISFNNEKKIIEGLAAYGLFPKYEEIELCAEENVLYQECLWVIEGQFALHFNKDDYLEMWNRTTTTKYGNFVKVSE